MHNAKYYSILSASEYQEEALRQASTGNMRDSLTSIQLAIDLEPRVDYIMFKVHLLRDLAEFDEATLLVTSLIEHNPQKMEYYYTRAQILQQRAKQVVGSSIQANKPIDTALVTKIQQAANRDFELITQNKPNASAQTTEHYIFAMALYNLENHSQALVTFDQLESHKNDASYGTFLAGKADVLRKLKRYQDALRYYDMAISHSPNAQKNLVLMAKMVCQYEYQNRTTLSFIEEIKFIIELNKSSHVSEQSKLYMEKMGKLYRQGKMKEMILVGEELLKEEPNHVQALMNVGLGYESLEKYENALSCYERVLPLCQDERSRVSALASLQRVHFYLDNLAESEKFGKEYLSSHPTDVKIAYELLIKTWDRLQKQDLIRKLLDEHQELYQAEMHFMDTYIILSEALHAQGQYKKELEFINKRFTNCQDEDVLWVMMNRAAILKTCKEQDIERVYKLNEDLYEMDSKSQQYIELAKELITLAPSVSSSYHLLGLGYGNNGELEKAVQIIQEGIKNAPALELYVDLGDMFIKMNRREELKEIISEIKLKYRNSTVQKETTAKWQKGF
jgi:tetratricopeptide (TPR) repeat protein